MYTLYTFTSDVCGFSTTTWFNFQVQVINCYKHLPLPLEHYAGDYVYDYYDQPANETELGILENFLRLRARQINKLIVLDDD